MRRKILAAALLFSSAHAFAQGGPPLITDDPGTPGNGHWEINIAALWTGSPGNEVVETPYFDVNYGLGDHLQLKLESGLTIVHQNTIGVDTGWGSAIAGVKWRFLDEETSGVSVSTYPQISFHSFFSSQDTVVSTPGTSYILPVEASKSFGKFALNPEFGYMKETLSPSEFFYGLVTAYEFQKDREALFEIHGQNRPAAGGEELILNIGTNYLMSEATSLLIAIGHTVTHYDDDSQHFIGYLGLQLRI
jgi:hypothetical protein